ncbi:DUF1353 domain-containing protein [Aestuariibius sp. 2305UL40-4]|uniref:DUF1353 domain-containing protein n=1 Tax=Aestuariibius violaceus TaxID=3234132 RepID=UPI00345EF7F5
MKRLRLYDHPEEVTNPYPDEWSFLSDLDYLDALVLVRPKGSVEMRVGQDADYIVGAQFRIRVLADGEQREVAVPPGLITDLTSVPQFVRWVVGRVGPWLEAAIVHDYLYIAWQDIEGRRPLEQDRHFADRIMLEAMKTSAVGFVRRSVIYAAVRVFGGFGFRRRSEQRYVDVNDLDLPPFLGRRS